MITRNRNDGQIGMRLVTFAGVVFSIVTFVVIVVMWFVRMLLDL